jgi:hypothetical protein
MAIHFAYASLFAIEKLSSHSSQVRKALCSIKIALFWHATVLVVLGIMMLMVCLLKCFSLAVK